MFRYKEYVLEIYKTGSFSKAAANLFMSQPSLSIIIKKLENEIGEPLFDRSFHPVKLTECGKKYVSTALSIMSDEDNFLSFLDDYRNLSKGSIAIGGSNMNISYILPPIIKKFIKEYPDIELKLIEGNIDVLMQKLSSGEIDLLIDSCDVDLNLFQYYLYIRENLLLVVPDNFSLAHDAAEYALTYDDIRNNRHLEAGIKPLPLNYLGSIPFIALTPETDTYRRTVDLCRHYSYEMNIIASFNQSATSFNLSCAGIGATFASDELVKNINRNADIHFYKVLPQFGTRYIKFYLKKGQRLSYAMRALIAIAQNGMQYSSYDLPDYEQHVI